MAARTASKRIETSGYGKLSRSQWIGIALTTALAAIVLVLIVQALALAIWPEAAAFRPLNSYPRTALFTLVPALIAAALFARLVRTRRDPVVSFAKIAIIVLLLSFIPDYLLPDPNRTFLASSIAAFMHLIAGIVITAGLVLGYQRVRKNSPDRSR